MSHPLYNPYASENQSSTQGQYGLSSIQTERDPRMASSHLGPGSSFSSSGASSVNPANSGGMLPSLLPQSMSYRSEQSRAIVDENIERSIDMHITRAREEVRPLGIPMHQPIGLGTCFTSNQRDEFLSSGTGMASYPMSSSSPFLGHRHSGESGSSSLDWLSNYKRPSSDDLSRFFSSSASSNYASGGDGRFNASSEREHDMKSIPGLGDCDYPVPDNPAAPPESRQPKYSSESVSSILLHFGLENEDLEHLLSYPEDQITPSSLPFILRQMRIEKTKKTTAAVQSKPCPEPQPTRSASGMDSHSLSSSGGLRMHQEEMSLAVLQPSKVIDYGHTGKYSGRVRDEIGRTSDSRVNSGGSMQLMDTYDSSRHSQETLQKTTTEVKSSALGSSHDQASSVSSLSSSYSSILSSVAPPSSDQTKRMHTQTNQTFQSILSTFFSLSKKDTDKSEASKPMPLKEPETDRQSTSKIQPPSTLCRDVHPSRPGLVHTSRIDASGTRDESKIPGQGSIVAEKMQPIQQKQPTQMQAVLQMGQTMWRPVSSAGKSIPHPHQFPPTLPSSKMQPLAKVAVSKGLPTAAMMHDYAAATPRIFPHTCCLCTKECTCMEDWITHQSTTLHLESCRLLREHTADEDAKPSPSTSLQTSQHPLQKIRHGSRSHSRSLSPHHHHGSEGRREKHSSRSRSPHSSRYTRSRSRSHSHSPWYDCPTSSRYPSHSRSTEQQSSPRRRDEKWSPPRKTDDRRSSPRRSRERRSSPRWSHERCSPSSSSDERRFPPRSSDERRSPPRRSDERRWSPRSSDERRSPPRRSDERRWSPISSDERRSPPRRSDERRSPPRWSDERRWSPSRRNERLSPPNRRDDRWSSSRRDDGRSSPRRSRERRLSPWWSDERCSPSSSGDERRMPPRASNERRSPTRWIDWRRSPPRRSDERRSPPRRSVQLRSPQRKRSSSTEILVKKAVQSLSEQCDLEAVAKTLVPAVLAELAKMMSSPSSSSSSIGGKPSSSSTASSAFSSAAKKKELTKKPSKAKPSLLKREEIVSKEQKKPPHKKPATSSVSTPQTMPKRKVLLPKPKMPSHKGLKMPSSLPSGAKKAKTAKTANQKRATKGSVTGQKTVPKANILVSKTKNISTKQKTKMVKEKLSVKEAVRKAVVKQKESSGSKSRAPENQLDVEISKPQEDVTKGQEAVPKDTANVVEKANVSSQQITEMLKTGTAKGAERGAMIKPEESSGSKSTAPENLLDVENSKLKQSETKVQEPVLKDIANVVEKANVSTKQITEMVKTGTAKGAVREAMVQQEESSGSKSTAPENQPEVENSKPKESETKVQEAVPKDTAKVVAKADVTVFEPKPQAELDKTNDAKDAEPMEVGEMRVEVAEPMEVGSCAEGQGEKLTPTEAVPETSADKSSESQPPNGTVDTQPTETSVKALPHVQQSTLSEPESTAQGLETKTEASHMQQQAAGSSTETAVEAKLPGGGVEMKAMQKACLMRNSNSVYQMKQCQKQLLITNLPEYQDGCYTEDDLAKLLRAFGFEHTDNSIYVVPQMRMAFVMMPTVENMERMLGRRGIHFKRFELGFQAVTGIRMTPLGIYKTLMELMSSPMGQNEQRIVFIKNISWSETKKLKEALKKIGCVKNFLPLLNKVFIEFESSHDADRLGVWYSLLKQAPFCEVHRLIVPYTNCTLRPPRFPKNALPISEDAVAGATARTMKYGIPQGSIGPSWVTLRAHPYLFPTVSPWFIIPNYLTVRGELAIKKASGRGSMFSTIMLTGLPGFDQYKHEDVAKLVWRYFPKQNLHSLYYNVTVLTLQRRAFVFFNNWTTCCKFVRDHIRDPVCVKGCKLSVHFVLEQMCPEFSEEMMYTSLMKWSNAGVPEPESLEERLLCVETSEMSVDVIRVVMEEVASIATFVGFLPLTNRICIEMADSSGVTKVVKKLNSTDDLKKDAAWSKVQHVESVKSLKQRLQDCSEITINFRPDAIDVDSEPPAVSRQPRPPVSQLSDNGSQPDRSTVSEPTTAGPSATAASPQTTVPAASSPATNTATVLTPEETNTAICQALRAAARNHRFIWESMFQRKDKKSHNDFTDDNVSPAFALIFDDVGGRRPKSCGSSSSKRSKRRRKKQRLDAVTAVKTQSDEAPAKDASECNTLTHVIVGEMIEKHLDPSTIRCLSSSSGLPQNFSKHKIQVLITNLPEYCDGCYGEDELVQLLLPFGFEHTEDSIHVIPQMRMAFFKMSSVKDAFKIIDTFKLKKNVFKGSELCFGVLSTSIAMTSLDFYISLMKMMRYPVDNEQSIVMVKNISWSETKELRGSLKKINGVKNFLPLLNKVFIQFESFHDADRLGVWYSLLKQAPGHEVHRLNVPYIGHTLHPPRLPKNALPDSKDAVAGATVPPMDFGIPQGSIGPSWVTLRTPPFLYPTVSPWFIIPDYLTVRGQEDIEKASGRGSMFSTIMLTGLPVGNCKHEDVAKLVWPYFPEQNRHSLYNVAVLTLQRRAFVFFADWTSCCDFARDHITNPVSVKERILSVHFVLEHIRPESSEEMMYTTLMKWSNAGVPEPKSLKERLLCVEISEASLDVIRVVMEMVASIATFVNFLPLANRICIEMADSSSVTRVLEKYSTFSPDSAKKCEAWSKVQRVEPVKSLKQRLQDSSEITIDLTLDTIQVKAKPPAVKCQTQPPPELSDNGSQPTLKTSGSGGSTIFEPFTAGPSATAASDVAKKENGDKPGTEIAVDSTVGPEANEDVDEAKVKGKEGSLTTLSSTAAVPAVSMPGKNYAELPQINPHIFQSLKAAFLNFRLTWESTSQSEDKKGPSKSNSSSRTATVEDTPQTKHHRSSSSKHSSRGRRERHSSGVSSAGKRTSTRYSKDSKSSASSSSSSSKSNKGSSSSSSVSPKKSKVSSEPTKPSPETPSSPDLKTQRSKIKEEALAEKEDPPTCELRKRQSAAKEKQFATEQEARRTREREEKEWRRRRRWQQRQGMDVVGGDDEEDDGKAEQSPPSQEDESVDFLNPETLVTLDEAADDEEEKLDREQTEKTSRSAKRKHDDDTEPETTKNVRTKSSRLRF